MFSFPLHTAVIASDIIFLEWFKASAHTFGHALLRLLQIGFLTCIGRLDHSTILMPASVYLHAMPNSFSSYPYDIRLCDIVKLEKYLEMKSVFTTPQHNETWKMHLLVSYNQSNTIKKFRLLLLFFRTTSHYSCLIQFHVRIPFLCAHFTYWNRPIFYIITKFISLVFCFRFAKFFHPLALHLLFNTSLFFRFFLDLFISYTIMFFTFSIPDSNYIFTVSTLNSLKTCF